MKERKIYLPKWTRWYVLPALIGSWLLITYSEFFGQEKLGPFLYILLTVVIWGGALIHWLQTAKKLSSGVIVDSDHDDPESAE